MNDASEPAKRKIIAARLLKIFAIIAGVYLVLILLLSIASFFIDEPLRRYTEKKVNSALKGYTVRISKLSLRPVFLSLTLNNVSISQDAHPDPPIARAAVIDAGIYPRSILSGMLVAEMKVNRPVLHLNLDQVREEAKEPEAAARWKRGLQAVQALCPLKLNVFSLTDGDVTYVDEDLKKPLHVTHLNVGLSNIRNRPSPKNQFPSPFHIDAAVFGSGRITVTGAANFLAEPLPTGKAIFEMSDIQLAYLKPILARSKIALTDGMLSTKGNVLYSTNEKVAEIDYLTIEKLKADFVQEGIKAVQKKEVKETTQEKPAKVEKPGLLLRLGRLELKDCEVGFENRYTSPTYRVFISDMNLLLTNLSNKFSLGPAKLTLSGKFMGSGITKADAVFRPETKGPDFDLALSIQGTEMKAMNNLLRAYGDFDVTEGKFSFFSELHVRNDQVTGYVKPLFRQMKVYDRRQDKEKSAFRKLYEKLVGGVAKLLENEPRKAVATKTDVSGKLESPKLGTWQALVNLLRNAYTRAILPGFEEEVRRLWRAGKVKWK